MRSKLGDYTPIWAPYTEQAWTAKKRKRQPPVEAPDTLRDLFRWGVRVALPNGGEKITKYGERFQDLHDHYLDVEDEKMWVFERPMGKGAFGAAGLFNKVAMDGATIDDVVVKSAMATRSAMSIPGLAIEAALMAQIQELNNDHMAVLRHYTYLDSQPALRFYLEHYEHGDLNRLALRYRAWQKRFPEFFLWHVFRCFAVAVGSPTGSLSSGTYRSILSANFGDIIHKGFLDHKDIKPENVFVGRKCDDLDYARVVVGDFGVSEVTAVAATNNTALQQEGGTPYWRSPEARISDMRETRYMRPFIPKFFPPITRQTPVGLHPLTPAVNVWPVGAIMWTLATGRDISSLDAYILNIFRTGRSLYEPYSVPSINFPKPMVADPETGELPETIEYIQPSPYSEELLELIRDCLIIAPSKRPTPAQLLQRVEAGYRNCFDRELAAIHASGDAYPKHLDVFDNKNDIQSQSLGDAGYELDERFWDMFLEDQMWLPANWGPLWPINAPGGLRAPEHWPYRIRVGFDEMKQQQVAKYERERVEADEAARAEVERAAAETQQELQRMAEQVEAEKERGYDRARARQQDRREKRRDDMRKLNGKAGWKIKKKH